MTTELRLIDEDGLEEAAALGRLAFGVPAPEPGRPQPPCPVRREWGAYDAGVLVAKVALLDYEQWWGGRRVPMGGLSGVAAHPAARGSGLVRRLLDELALPAMAESGQVVSALYPTAPGIYRSRSWELAGELVETVLPLHLLATVPRPGDVQLRAGTVADADAVQRAYDTLGASTDGLLTRTGPGFPRGPAGLFEADVTLAEVDGTVLGYVAYDRTGDAGLQTQLRIIELVAPTRPVLQGLVASVAGWSSVVDRLQWTGDLADLALLLGARLPAPISRRPWMLRVNDVPGALAARGWPAGVDAQVSVAVVGDGPGAGWHVRVADGHAEVEPADAAGLPELHVRGLARLYAGAGDSRQLLRAGLLDRPCPALDAVFGGPGAQLLDFF